MVGHSRGGPITKIHNACQGNGHPIVLLRARVQATTRRRHPGAESGCPLARKLAATMTARRMASDRTWELS